jgi:aspartyl-tRNA(Asn)/glutamyl-tRNA(Gln) amidotransferase subunit A
VLEAYFGAIESNRHLNAFIEVFHQTALEQARKVDEKIANNQSLGKLFGVVVSIKDVISYKNHSLSASSKILQNYTAVFSATAIEKLLAEDAIIIGRLGCDEFAMGSSNESSFYGVVRNPIDETKVPGGSSGASAVAVKAGLSLVSLGSDTGGSVRQPAAFCGVVGLKPTYGRVSRYGLIAYGSSFDQIGPIANSVEDAALVLQVIAGYDEYDSTVSSSPVSAYSEFILNDAELSQCKVGYYEEALHHPGIDPDIKSTFEATIQKLKNKGCVVDSIHLKELEYIVPTYYVLTTAEASSNLSRFDGIRYGYRSENAHDLESTYKKSRAEGFGMEVKRRIMSGTFVLSSGYYDAYYTKAQKVRRIISDKTTAALQDYDFIICPTTPTTAYPIGAMSNDPIAMYLGDIFTVQANLTGMPAISLPLGEDKNGLPIGIQLMANKFDEFKMLNFANWLTQN